MNHVVLVLLCGNRLLYFYDDRESDPWLLYDRQRYGLQWCTCRTCRRFTGRAGRQPVVRVKPGRSLPV